MSEQTPTYDEVLERIRNEAEGSAIISSPLNDSGPRERFLEQVTQLDRSIGATHGPTVRHEQEGDDLCVTWRRG